MPGPVIPGATPAGGGPTAPATPPGTQPVSARGGTGSLEDRIAHLETELNFLSDYTAYPITNEPGPNLAFTLPTILGGITVPWGLIRRVLRIPDSRWDAWTSGWLLNAGGTTTIEMFYQGDNVHPYVMGGVTFPVTATQTKVAIGPYPVRGAMAAALGAPQNEQILSIGVQVTVSGGTAHLPRWTLWIRQSPTRS